jgi:hypothetical protein
MLPKTVNIYATKKDATQLTTSQFIEFFDLCTIGDSQVVEILICNASEP